MFVVIELIKLIELTLTRLGNFRSRGKY